MARLAKALETLRDQVDKLVPDRSKSSDGWIGDTAHSARASDHNPNKDGIVTALDITHDPAHGVDAGKIADSAVADDRTKYVIWNRRIASGTGQDHPAGVWRPYSGSNPHNLHVHVSVKGDPAKYDATTPWKFVLVPSSGGVVTRRRLKRGDEGDDVEELQRLLGIAVDGKFGDGTDAAVRAFQAEHKIEIDGIVGPYTWQELLPAEPATPSRIFSNIKATVFNDRELAYGPVAADTVGVSLPASLDPKTRIWIRNRANGLTAIAEVIDKGPWNIDDPYWETNTRPQAETGTDRKGRKTNKAGIDLYPETARRLGISFTIRGGAVVAGEGYIDWGFAGELPVELPEVSPIEAILKDIELVLRKHLEKEQTT